MLTTMNNIISSITKDGLMLACGIMVLLLLAFVTYTSVYVKAANPDALNILLGQITTLAAGIVGYYFGTSKSSVDMTRIMADSMKPPTP